MFSILPKCHLFLNLFLKMDVVCFSLVLTVIEVFLVISGGISGGRFSRRIQIALEGVIFKDNEFPSSS